MDGACGTYEEARGFWWESLKGKNCLEDVGVDGRIQNGC